MYLWRDTLTDEIFHNNSEFDICKGYRAISILIVFSLCCKDCSCIFTKGFAMFNSLLKLLLAVVTLVSSLCLHCVCGVINAGFVSTNGNAALLKPTNGRAATAS